MSRNSYGDAYFVGNHCISLSLELPGVIVFSRPMSRTKICAKRL